MAPIFQGVRCQLLGDGEQEELPEPNFREPKLARYLDPVSSHCSEAHNAQSARQPNPLIAAGTESRVDSQSR
jgi:hypothetical protein